jgi:hypothetical protein
MCSTVSATRGLPCTVVARTVSSGVDVARSMWTSQLTHLTRARRPSSPRPSATTSITPWRGLPTRLSRSSVSTTCRALLALPMHVPYLERGQHGVEQALGRCGWPWAFGIPRGVGIHEEHYCLYHRVPSFVSLPLCLNFKHFMIYVFWCNTRIHVIIHISGHVWDVLYINASVLATRKDPG